MLRAGVPVENRHDTQTPLCGSILVVARAMESAGSGRAVVTEEPVWSRGRATIWKKECLD